MNKYLILFICFIGSLLLVTYDNNEVVESFNYQESVYVFNEIDVDTNIVNNPDTRDINIYVYFVIAFYSLLFIMITVKNLKKVNKYVDIKKF